MASTPRTRASRRRADAPSGDAEAAKRALCAAAYSDPACVVATLSHELTGRFAIEPHRHADLLQLDLIVGCTGELVVDDRPVAVHGTTLMVAYPGRLHGYTLAPAHPPSEVWLVKLRVPPAWRRPASPPLPEMLTGLSPQTVLHESMARFFGQWTGQGRTAAALSHLASVISHWPTSTAEMGVSPYASAVAMGDGASSRVRRVVELLGRRYHDPPGLDELAKAANLSARQFARRFQAEYACTPHQYLSARRLDVARSLLLRHEVPITEVAADMGFTSPAAFSRWFTRLAGQSPRAFREDPETF